MAKEEVYAGDETQVAILPISDRRSRLRYLYPSFTYLVMMLCRHGRYSLGTSTILSCLENLRADHILGICTDNRHFDTWHALDCLELEPSICQGAGVWSAVWGRAKSG
jgi:hypothetical protein